MTKRQTEFDDYSRNYTAGMEDPIKAALGKSAATFLLAKIQVLRRVLARYRQFSSTNPEVRALDFGCGTGDFISLLTDQGFLWQTHGCDVSSGMLAEARLRHPNLRSPGRLWVCAPEDFPRSAYDIVTAVCVFHHIRPSDWQDWFRRLNAAMHPGGLLLLFEHNPWNLITRWVVSRAPIDRNAVLLSPLVARRSMKAAGFVVAPARYFLFLPPRFPSLQRVERPLSGIPLGGQYLLAGQVNSSSAQPGATT